MFKIKIHKFLYCILLDLSSQSGRGRNTPERRHGNRGHSGPSRRVNPSGSSSSYSYTEGSESIYTNSEPPLVLCQSQRAGPRREIASEPGREFQSSVSSESTRFSGQFNNHHNFASSRLPSPEVINQPERPPSPASSTGSNSPKDNFFNSIKTNKYFDQNAN